MFQGTKKEECRHVWIGYRKAGDYPCGAAIWVDLNETTVKDEDEEPIDSPNPLRQSFKNTIKKMQKERNIYCCQNG